jgi:Family of unknown function (DUF5522)
LKTNKRLQKADELLEGRDYYMESGNMVFTADFLRRRGYCCESGCRHCPYGFGPEGLRKKLQAEQ